MSTSNRQDRSVEIAVIGGGVSGLTCGFWLKQAGRSVAVLEGTARAGGSIRTLARDGWIFEQGPNTITDAGGDVARLCDALGIASRIREASPEAKRRYIYRASGTQGADGNRGRLVPLPTSPPAFLASPLLPFGAKFGLLREPFIPPRRDAGEESVADFVRRRLGQPYLDTLVGPFVSGVYAGDPEKLSVRWAVKVIHGLEQEHGSLIRGALARRKGPAPGGRLVSFPEGLEELPRALARSLGTDLYLNAEVTGLAQANGGFLLETKEQGGIGRLRAERVILAAPADAASRLLSALGPSERCDLAGIPYAPVVSVALGFRDQNLGARLKGFGFLVPRVENLTILGCLFSSSLFEGRAPEGCVALTVLVGGATQPEILQMDEAALLAMVLRDLRKALGALPDPIFRHVTRWPRAIPQYNLGHGRFVEAARSLEEAFPGIHVGGNLLEGVSLADCIRNARSLAASIVTEKDMTVEATAGND